MSDIVVDTSAAVALLSGGPTAGRIALAIDDADRLLMSAATLVELSIVLEGRLGPVGTAVTERLLRAGGVTIVDVDRETADRAVDAWRRFGKGRHPAGLNYGDCFSYALATIEGATLLCTGDDFVRTDLPVIDLT